MTDDHFAALGIPRAAALDPEAVKDRFHQLSREHHPDSGKPGADSAHFERLNRAQAALTATPARLRHLHELEYGVLDRGGAISDSLMSLFGEIGIAVQSAQAFSKKKDAAQSALAKALLESELPKAQLALAAAQAKVTQAIAAIESTLPAAVPGRAPLAAAYRELAFLTRWRTQLQSAFASLF